VTKKNLQKLAHVPDALYQCQRPKGSET
jgi:hypothetical protein